MSELNYDVTTKQVATNELSAVARLDRPTEDKLYRLYRDFFRVAEEQRRWSIWVDIPWDEPREAPSESLVEAVLDNYREDSFLPDYSMHVLRILRASRGRAWFLTRWSYEEGKHLIALSEWLTRTKSRTDTEMREFTEAHLRTFRWTPPDEEPFAVLADMLLWELGEIDRYTTLRDKAQSAEDVALIAATDLILGDETAHRDFLRDALAICNVSYGPQVAEAITRLAATEEFPGGADALTERLAIPAATA